MSDEEIRRAEREDPAKAERLRARLLAPDDGFRWTTLDGRTLRLHEIADDHLVNIIKRQVRRALKERGLWGDGVLFWWRTSGNRDTAAVLLGTSFEERYATTLLAEARRRGLAIGTQWLAYLTGVLRGACDSCLKRRATVKPYGPTDVLLCATCARGWEWACSRCGTPCATCQAAKRHEIPLCEIPLCLRLPVPGTHALCEAPGLDVVAQPCGARMAWLPRAGSRQAASGEVSLPPLGE